MGDDVRAEDCWEAEVTVTVTFEITGSVAELGLHNYETLDATSPFGARQLLEAMKDSGGSVYKELRNGWGFPGREYLAEVNVFVRDPGGVSEASVMGPQEERRG